LPSAVEHFRNLVAQRDHAEGLGNDLHTMIEVAVANSSIFGIARHEQYLQIGARNPGGIGNLATVEPLVAEVLQEAGYVVIEAADGPSGLRILPSDVRINLTGS
jgi:hypothetical protein